MMQSVQLIGRLVRDPEANSYKTRDGKVARFTIAVVHTHGKLNRATGKYEGEASAFVTVKAFDRENFKLAALCMERLEKGSPVAVQGRLLTETWEKDGKQQYALVLTADNVQFLGTGKDRAPRGEDVSEGTEDNPRVATEAPSEDNIPF